VPEDILGIEKLLAAEYKTKNEAAEKEYRQRRKLQEEAEEKQRKKRKRDEEALLAEVLADSCTSGNGAKKSKPNKVRWRILVLTLSVLTPYYSLLKH